MKSWSYLLILPVVALLAFLAPVARAGGGLDRTPQRMEAELRGPAPMGGEVHYVQNGNRIRVKVAVWGLKVPDAYLTFDGKPYRLVLDLATGTGYALLDTRAGDEITLTLGSKVRVMSGSITLMAGELH